MNLQTIWDPSFTSVIGHIALRFHMHKLAVISPGRVYNQTELRDINEKNNKLAKFMDHMYYTSSEDGNIGIGGETKVERSKSGDPGFTLIDKTSPLLSVLTKDLYALLKTLYAATDFKELKRYAVEVPTQREWLLPQRGRPDWPKLPPPARISGRRRSQTQKYVQ